MKMKKTSTPKLIDRLNSEFIEQFLPECPDGYLGYEVEKVSHMWHAIWLLHPPYCYKEGVRTIHSYVKNTGMVYRPGHKKPSVNKLCELTQLPLQNPYTGVETKPNPLLKYL